MNVEILLSSISVIVAVLALLVTSFLLSRQVRQMEHERNALAIMQAIERLTDDAVVEGFQRLRGMNERYPSDDTLLDEFRGSSDEHDLYTVVALMETVAALTRRGVVDPSLIVDAYGAGIRTHWLTIQPFMIRYRKALNNADICNNLEWLANYSAWWKELPRPAGDRNYDPRQFEGVIVQP